MLDVCMVVAAGLLACGSSSGSSDGLAGCWAWHDECVSVVGVSVVAFVHSYCCLHACLPAPPACLAQDIPGGHPYLLSLGILGGIYAFENPLQGCLLVSLLRHSCSAQPLLHTDGCIRCA